MASYCRSLLVFAATSALVTAAPFQSTARAPRAAARRLRGGHGDGGGGIDIDSLLELTQSPEAAEELRKLQEDPEAMRAAREMMDDPEFRAQMMEALTKGENRGEKFKELQERLSGENVLTESLKELGPSLGACLDVLKRNAAAKEFDDACKTLDGITRRLADKGLEDARYRRLRLSNEMLESRLLRFPGGQRCLEALGFTEEVEVEGEAHLEYGGKGLETATLSGQGSASPSLHGGAFGRLLDVIAKAREEVIKAELVHKEHGVAYAIALELPTIRRACGGDQELGQLLTYMLLENEEFRLHTTVDAVAEHALPAIMQMLRSKEGIQGLVEYYTGAPLADSGVVRVQTLSEWKDALAAAGDKTVCALFTAAQDVRCRVLTPAFSRLPKGGDGAFTDVAFLLVALDASQDDGLTQQVFEEAYVGLKEVPTFVFLGGCLEHKKWRYVGNDIQQVMKRLKRIVADDRLDDGPDAAE